jgi:type I restriction enzyme M protein
LLNTITIKNAVILRRSENVDVLIEVLKDSNYALTLFDQADIDALKERVNFREVRGVQKSYVPCLIREKEILLKPEEIVRQLYLAKLLRHYHYPKERITVEHPVSFGREKKSADIVVFDSDRPTVEYIIVELKKPKLLDGKNQLRSYCNATGAPIGVWTNGSQISHYNRKAPNYFNDITQQFVREIAFS